MSDAQTGKAGSLRKILRGEVAGGFRDTTVIGGLDRFLQRWTDELSILPGGVDSYSALTVAQRKVWAEQVISKLDGAADESDARAAAEAPPKRGTSQSRPGPITLADSLYRLSGFTPKNLPAARVKRLGVETVGDLLLHLPHRHNDFANVRKVSELEPGEEQTVVVNVWEAAETRGGRMRSTQAVLGDDTGNVRAVWFNQPYLARTMRAGTELVISGKVNLYRGSFVFESPEYELLRGQEELVHTGRLVPVYPSVEGLPQRTLRRLVKRALEAGLPLVEEYAPQDTLHRTGLMGLPGALAQAHYPDSTQDWSAARRRLAFDELLLLQLAALSRKRAWQEDNRGIALKADPSLIESFVTALPFDLTAAQTRVVRELLGDLEQARPMSRLLQGDVGSGKTVVAAAALFVAASNGYQGALMAPTELLAEQHFLTLSRLTSPSTEAALEDTLATIHLDALPRPLSIGLLLGSLSRKAKSDMHQRIADGEIDVIVGTHALIQGEVEVPRLALAIVDEQHRFGVMQRAAIRGKGLVPHLLAMSATPIPRSLALTVYGDLDVSTIDEMPPGRQAIRTRWLKPNERDRGYEFIRRQVAEGRQAFVVCPLIEDSEVIQARAATEEHERLAAEVFPELRLGLLHGRMALREKEQAMERFLAGETHVLVSTPVVEVGIDVPNATVMLVDGADRFGLAQLHQFRGRVGRGQHKSYCLLLSDSPGKGARVRLKLVERIQDGFQLAEEDLRLRGPGEYLGTRQSGLPDLKVARITDYELLALARKEAQRILDADPALTRDENAGLAERMRPHTDRVTAEAG